MSGQYRKQRLMLTAVSKGAFGKETVARHRGLEESWHKLGRSRCDCPIGRSGLEVYKSTERTRQPSISCRFPTNFWTISFPFFLRPTSSPAPALHPTLHMSHNAISSATFRSAWPPRMPSSSFSSPKIPALHVAWGLFGWDFSPIFRFSNPFTMLSQLHSPIWLALLPSNSILGSALHLCCAKQPSIQTPFILAFDSFLARFLSMLLSSAFFQRPPTLTPFPSTIFLCQSTYLLSFLPLSFRT